MAMRFPVIALLLAAAICLAGCTSTALMESAENSAAPAATGGDKQNVLVELFTSEGCSSCPPADKVLAYLDREPVVPGANVITLGLHVDYWDRLGWRDRFSSNEYTQRQEAYARQLKLNSTYTPQMVVDGSAELVGSNSAGAVDAIMKSVSTKKGVVTLGMDAGKLNIKVDELPPHGDATVYLAVAESKLLSDVRGGENAGSKLEHASVVRQLTPIGSVTADQKTFSLGQVVPTDASWKPANVKYVIFVQDNATLKILAVGQTS
jgi:hypothetical protein